MKEQNVTKLKRIAERLEKLRGEKRNALLKNYKEIRDMVHDIFCDEIVYYHETHPGEEVVSDEKMNALCSINVYLHDYSKKKDSLLLTIEVLLKKLQICCAE